jgi:hypothetical protein
MTSDLTLLALYENRKLTITLNYRIHRDACGFSPSYVYAVANDIFPFFQDNRSPSEGIIDPFNGCYRTTEVEISEILNFIDEEWLKDKLYSFYDLEDHFSEKYDRVKLIHVLRYSYLDGRFDEKLWGKIVSSAPIEGKSVTRKLADWEI